MKALFPHLLTGCTAILVALLCPPHLCAGSSSQPGVVVAWGDNSYGESTVPGGLNNVVQIAASGAHSLALKSDGTVVAWGQNNAGQSTVPGGLNNVVQIAAGQGHSLALKADGTVVAWGENYYGESAVPDGLTNVVQISAGQLHSLALKADGTVVAWGDNYYGERAVPIGLNNVVRISAGGGFSLALKADGTVVAWGDHRFGKDIVPGGLNNVVQISAGGSHSLALKSDGTVVAWGEDGYGQSTMPSGLSNVVQISAGVYHSLALKSDGAVVAWGSNSSGESTVPSGLKDVGQIAAGEHYSLAVVRIALSILSAPQNQTVTAGQSAAFSVAATGLGPLGYQWRVNGINIPGQTGSTLSIPNTQLANAGNYTVTVSTSAGQVTSTSAKLTVLSNLDFVPLPIQSVYSDIPAKGAGTDSLIIVTHGWEPLILFGPPPLASWVTDMGNSIQQYLASTGQSNWAVVTYNWIGSSTNTGAYQPVPDLALGYADNWGRNLGKRIVAGGWSHVHLIAHSAGSALIQAAAKYIHFNSSITIHTTFLDPYVGLNHAGVQEYGRYADWADDYFSHDLLTGGEFFSLTEGPLDYAHNVEVTWLDPAKGIAPQYCSSQNSTPATLTPCAYLASSTHEWPHDFYQDTIPPIPANRLPGYEGYGFPLSKEGGGWANRSTYPVRNSPHVLAAQSGIPQSPILITTGSVYNFSILAHPTGQTGSVQFNSSGFTATTGGAPFSPQSIGKDGSIQTNAAATGSPAWTSIPVDVTSNVNFVTFNAVFTSQAGAMGLLTVYWNDVEIGRIDERDVLLGVQTYTFGIADTFHDRSNSLGFRIDQFSAVASSVSVTNVATGFGGLTNSPKLQIENISGISAPVLTLTGTVNYTYLVETSQDLVNWEPMAAVTLDTGVAAALTDPSAPGLQMRFYRAVSP